MIANLEQHKIDAVNDDNVIDDSDKQSKIDNYDYRLDNATYDDSHLFCSNGARRLCIDCRRRRFCRLNRRQRSRLDRLWRW